jgi:hypothetical protein
MAAVGNERLNPKTKLDIDARVGVVSIETGIRRQGDVGYKEEEFFAVIDGRQRAKDQTKVIHEERVVLPLVDDPGTPEVEP